MAESMVPASPANRRRSGNSIIELTFMMPWLLFLFVGVFDFGFYAYALIATQNAARAVAVHNSISKTAASDPDGSGCQIAVAELQTAAYGRSLTGCSTPTLNVMSTYDTSGSVPSAKVVVKYQTALLIPIPGVLPGQTYIIGAASMPVNPSANF